MCYIPNDDSRDKHTEEIYKEFVLYFEGWNNIGIPYGMSDLVRRAEELGLPIPSIKDDKLVWNDQQ